MPNYKIADVVFSVEFINRETSYFFSNYLYDGPIRPAFSAFITEKDIENERNLIDLKPYILESVAIQRKLCEYVLSEANGLIFHSSAIMVDGNAYLFTAPSGTGKSTHTRLWRELLGSRAVMINDDKPIIRYIDGDFYVYGTPWTGKHGLGENIKVKLKAVCSINRGEKNVIRGASKSEMIPVLLNQTLRPKNIEDMDKLLSLTDNMLDKVNLYKLYCNMELDAAKVSYNAMVEGKI